MDSLKTDDLGKILGLFDPWRVTAVELISDTESIVISVEKKHEKSRFNFLQTPTRAEQTTKRWQHVRFGHFNTFIQASMSLEELAEITADLPPAFLGAEHKSITRELADTIRIAYSRQLNADMISGLMGISNEIVEAEIREIDSAEQQKNFVALLPLESNEVWRSVLMDQVKLSTRLLPLKLLLSRLKLEVNKNPNNTSVMQRSVLELRAFFIRHATQLKSEYEQLGVYESPQPSAPAANQNAKLKLVLPGTRSVLWHQLLTGELNLESESMPLKLNLAQQKRAYRTSLNDAQRTEIIRNLQLFFKHNARNLIPELKILTNLVNQGQQEPEVMLPGVDHIIWQKLLLDDRLLQSEKINYRLLLSRLKTNYRRTQDKSYLEQLRSFFSQNARTMGEEIQLINKLAANQ